MSEERDSSDWTKGGVHFPLPYVVRLRVVVDQDRPPEVQTIRCVAYTLMEAMLQAMFEVGGKAQLQPDSYKVETITPDLEAFYALILSPKMQEAIRGVR